MMANMLLLVLLVGGREFELDYVSKVGGLAPCGDISRVRLPEQSVFAFIIYSKSEYCATHVGV